MSVSSNSVSYRLLLLSLFLTPFLLSGSNALTNKFSCIKQKDKDVIAFFVEKGSGETVSKIYAKGKENDCTTPDPIVGAGTAADPYSLTIHSDDFIKCDVKKESNEQKVTFIIKTGKGEFAAATEVDVKCDFRNLKIGAKVNSNVAFVKGSATKSDPAVTMKFTGTPLTVGADTTLELELTTKNGFKGIKPYKCSAKRSESDTKTPVPILDNYCAVSSAPVPLVFSPKSGEATISQSATFKAFRFYDSETLVITCEVDLCVDVTKCAKHACKGRKKRSANDQPTHLVTTNATIVIRGKGSSLL